jgi:hypothetical protein
VGLGWLEGHQDGYQDILGFRGWWNTKVKVVLEFDLDKMYVDEFLPISNQPILKIMNDVHRIQSLILDKLSKDDVTSDYFRNLSYEELYKKIDAWATRDRDEEMKEKERMRKDGT